MATSSTDTGDEEPVVTRPALKVLQADQRKLLDPSAGDRHALRAGFPDRQALIMWYQRAVVRTFGRIADSISPLTITGDPAFVAHCLRDHDARTSVVDDPPTDAVARNYRNRLEANVVLPAANAAYQDLRAVAGEYGDEDGDELVTDTDPTDQKFVAMRPGFQQKGVEQRRALEQLWGGFKNRSQLLDWLHHLNEPSYGAIPDDLPGRVMNDQVATAHLIGDGVEATDASQYREQFAVSKLLPAFINGIKSMDSFELAAQRTDKRHIPQG